MKKLSYLTLLLTLTTFLGINIANAEETKIPSNLGGITMESANPNSIKPSAIIVEMAPGTVYNDTVIIRNTTDYPITVTNNATDSTTTTTGDFTMKSSQEKQENIGAWTIIEESQITLEPQTSKSVNFTITIPQNTELKEYKGGITSTQRGEEIGGVITSTRIVTLVELKVTNDPQPTPKLIVETQVNIFTPTPFFWGTIAIFLSSMSYLIYTNRKEKKQKIKNQV